MPDKSQAVLYVHGFCKWGTIALFDMQIFNLYAGSYLRQTPEKPLEMAEKEKMISTSRPVWILDIILLLWCNLRMKFLERRT